MFLFLDESGDLGFNFENPKTSRYLVIGILACLDNAAHKSVVQAVRRTLRNKLPKNTPELKGNRLPIDIKKYFLKELKNDRADWSLYIAIADKKAWLTHYISKHYFEPKKEVLYNELAKRLFFELNYRQISSIIDVVVDCSKNKKSEIDVFNEAILSVINLGLSKKVRVHIRHADSQINAGLQAIDLFCSGVGRKYEKGDCSWYQEFADRIAVEVQYKF